MTKSRNILGPRTQWTSEKDGELARRYPDEKAAAIANDMGIPVHAVYARANALGLKKSEAFLANPALSGRTDGTRGASGRFQKGNVPWTKGMKGLQLATHTQFKPGRLPHNTQPIGTIKLSKDGLLLQKVSNAKGNNSARWRTVHELVWVKENGPLPSKHIVIFKPGMRTAVLEEITADKLECISLEENMRRNTRHNLPPELNEIIHMRAVLSRQINKRSKA